MAHKLGYYVLYRVVQAGQPLKWNTPRSNIAKVAATYWSFILLGSNDSSYGVILPHLETYYNVSYLQVSLVFLSPVVGFIVSTLANRSINVRLGHRGVAIIAGTCQLIAYTIACLHPPFYALVLAYALVGMGCGAKQASWNSFVGSFNHANELLGLLHGCYGIGATILPVVASALFSSNTLQWYMIYYILIGMTATDLAFSLSVFYTHGGTSTTSSVEQFDLHQASPAVVPISPLPHGPPNERLRSSSLRKSVTWACFKNKVVILCSIYLLAYVGAEVALGGWLVTFMMKVRHGSAFASGVTTSGLWAGITLGRMLLGFVTGRLFPTEKHAVACYLLAAMVLELMFWLIPNFITSAVSAAFLGFFLGPLFPGVIVCISRLLPRSMQVTAIGICSAVGASGASIVPFMVGAIAQAKGVAVLQPIILALLVFCLLLWLVVPKLPSRVD